MKDQSLNHICMIKVLRSKHSEFRTDNIYSEIIENETEINILR